MNTVQLLGRTTAQIELKMTPQGKAVAQFTLAVKRPYTKDVTDFLNIVVWDKQAELASKYVAKGSMIAIEGYITNRTWETPEGEKRSKTEIVAGKIHFTGKNETTNAPVQTESNTSADSLSISPEASDYFKDVQEYDLPF